MLHASRATRAYVLPAMQVMFFSFLRGVLPHFSFLLAVFRAAAAKAFLIW